MTSISGSMSTAAMMSPSDRMKIALQSAVSAGTVKSTDQNALSNALDDIGAALKSAGKPAAGTSPNAMKTKIASLIDQEVAGGKLTSDQASELKTAFADAAKAMHGAKGARGPGGSLPPPPAPDGDNDAGASTGSTSASSASATTGANSTKSAIEQMIAFLKTLDQQTSSSTPYGANGTSTASNSTSSSVLIDTLA